MSIKAHKALILAVALTCQVGIARAGLSADADRTKCETNAEGGVCAEPPSRLPAEVAAHLKGMTDECRQVKGEPLSSPKIEHGSLAAGLEFWAFDEAGLQCKGAETLYSGSHGSDVVVYVSKENAQVKQALVQGAYGMAVEPKGGRSDIWVTVAGQLCGQKGDPTTAELKFCQRTLRWEVNAGKLTFGPMSEARPLRQSGKQTGGLPQTSAPVQAKQSADIPGPLYYQPAVHNGSTMVFREWKDGVVEIVYDVPRRGLPATKGTLLFRGVKSGTRLSGVAYTFKAGCSPAPYPVSGIEDGKRELIVLTGIAPRRVGNSCDVNGQTKGPGNTKLVFDIHIDGDE